MSNSKITSKQISNISKANNINLNSSQAKPSEIKEVNALITNSCEVMFIKIVNSEIEFEDFFNNNNTDKAFHPTFTNQFFGDEQKIVGYKDLKIYLALTPLSWFPCYKIAYSYKEDNADDIEKMFNAFIDSSIFNKNEDAFKHQLNKELGISNFSDFESKDSSKLELVDSCHVNINDSSDLKGSRVFNIYRYKIDYIDKFYDYHLNIQKIMLFFINGASEIPVKEGRWYEYLIYDEEMNNRVKEENKETNDEMLITDKNKNNNNTNNRNSKLVGMSTVAHFHMSAVSFRTMISQFFIQPNYQRKGLGFKLLDNIHNKESAHPDCIDVTTEDPGDDYNTLRDVVFFKNTLPYFSHRYNDILKKHFSFDINKTASVSNIKTIDDFDMLTLSQPEIEKLSKTWKLTPNTIRRIELLMKFCVGESNKQLEDVLSEDLNAYIFSILKNNEKINKSSTPSFISFDEDEEDIDYNDNNNTINEQEEEKKFIEDVQRCLADLYEDFKKIKEKCLKIIYEYDNDIIDFEKTSFGSKSYLSLN